MDNKIIKAISLVAILFLGFSLASCGKKEEVRETDSADDGYEYVATFESIESDLKDGIISNKAIDKDYIYLLVEVQSGDKNNFSVEYNIEKINIKTKDREIIKLEAGEAGSFSFISRFIVFDDGYVFLTISYDAQKEQSMPSIIYTDKEGKQTAIVSLDRIEKDFYPNEIKADKEGNIYCLLENRICKINKNGELVGNIKFNDWGNSFCVADDGTTYIFLLSRNEGKFVMKTADFNKGKLGEEIVNSALSVQGINLLENGDIFIIGQDEAFLYDVNAQKEELLWKWLDLNMESIIDSDIIRNDDGSFNILYQSYIDYSPSEIELVTVNKQERTAENAKTTISLAGFGLDYSLKQQIITFNKKSDKYRIEVTDYLDMGNDYLENYEKYDVDVIQGKYDIVAIDNNKYVNYVRQGIITDLYPYLQNDKDINTEELNEKILKAYEINGKLYAVIPYVSLSTIVTAQKYVGDMTTWTTEDVIRLRKENPSKTFFNYVTQDEIVALLLSADYEKYINYETGECHLDTEDFKEILECAKTFPKEIKDDYDKEWERIMDGDIMFCSTCLYNFDDISLYTTLFNDEIRYIGYPSSEEKPVYLVTNNLYGICEKSEYKEEAWEFLKTMYASEYQKDSYEFPTNKKAFEEMYEEAIRDNIYIDENGVEQRNARGGASVGSVEVTLYKPTEEEAQIVRELYESADSVFQYDEELIKIITEEAGAFFEGQKSFEEVSGVIQSRVSIYLAEQGQQ